jgi:hypothetical protein
MKLAAYFSDSTSHASDIVDGMLAAQCARPWHTRRLACGSAGAVGAVMTSDRFSRVPAWYQSTTTRNHLCVTGLPLAGTTSTAAVLQELTERPIADAAARLARLDGAFAAVLWNELTSTCAVVTDALGMQPLYMSRRPGALALASEAKAITAGGVLDYTMSAAAWGSLLSFQHPIAGLTLADGVVRVPPGTVLTFDARHDRLSTASHAEWPRPRNANEIDDRFIQELVDALFSDLASLRQYHGDAVLLLSGGYDSRLLLAALTEMGVRPPVLIHDHSEELFGLEAFLAERVAREFGVPVTRARSDPRFFSSAGYLDYLLAIDVSVQSLYLFIAQMGTILTPDVEAIWEGTFPGCLLFPVHQPPGSFDAYLARECATENSPAWQAATRVFTPDVVRLMRDGFSDCLSNERARYSDDAHGVSEFIVRNRTRHRVAINALQVYATDVLPLTPGMTRRFWTRAASIPYDTKSQHALYQRLLRRHFPRAMKVPVVSGGRFHPLDSRARWGWLARSLGERLQAPHVQRLLWRLGARSGDYYWEPSTLVDAAVQETCASDPDLHSTEVRRLQAQRPPYDFAADTARMLLFYRHMARRAFTGELTYAGGWTEQDSPRWATSA